MKRRYTRPFLSAPFQHDTVSAQLPTSVGRRLRDEAEKIGVPVRVLIEVALRRLLDLPACTCASPDGGLGTCPAHGGYRCPGCGEPVEDCADDEAPPRTRRECEGRLRPVHVRDDDELEECSYCGGRS